ncbi:MAG: MFS transporter [Actinobacteria bacterium]|nr:MFS transporter [Actinomycetota bacterium]
MSRRVASGGISRREPVAWAGIAAVSAGVLLHLPMYVGAADEGYRLEGMPVDPPMLIGMMLIFAGLGLTAYGLLPRARVADRGSVARVSVKPLDDAPINGAHVGLLLVMAAAVTIDVMKPTTLAFVVPGFAAEYGLRSPINPAGHPAAALLPLAGITGTVLGSLSWGWLGDRIGRRASILLAGVLFVATAVCGSMPSYQLNLVMCFVMGLGVGGMLPIVFTLLAETIPSRHRGWLMVLIGGDVAGAYILTSWLSSALVPEYSWRILWLIGLPTGLLLIVLNRWIPESPRFLLAHGRDEDARAVMARYGAKLVPDQKPELAVEELVQSRFAQLFARPLRRPTAVVVLLGLGIGLVTFGFQLWIPTNLRDLGYADVTADRILRDSALIGFPLNFLIAWLYGFWSSKKTIVLLAGLTAVALFAFAVAGDAVAGDRTLLNALLVVPIWGISSLVAVLAAYSAEVYPTRIRSRGSGLAAAVSKAGGVVVIAIVVAAIAPPTITGTALLGAIPMALAALAAAIFGIETRKRRLEEITAQEFEAQTAR